MALDTTAGPVPSSADDYDDTPSGQAQKWAVEFAAARKDLEKFHERGPKIVKRFKDERPNALKGQKRWNLFTANVLTQRALVFGQTPRADVGRRFEDSKDDVARVAAWMLERLVNSDLEADDEGFQPAIHNALSDYQLPGLGQCRVAYEAEYEEGEGTPAMLDESGVELAPAVPAVETLADENACTHYVHWRDFLWSPARTWEEVRWVAYRNLMSREDLVKRFGAEGKLVPLNAKTAKAAGRESDSQRNGPWGRAEVWEVWDKSKREVCWYVEGFSRLLDTKPDTLGLDGFYPSPRPLAANLTTDSLVPTPDFAIAQDQYDEVDELTMKIDLLVKAVRAVGVYDGDSEELKRLLTEGRGNEMIPVKGWGGFAEKGGLKGAFELMPLADIVACLDKLREVRAEAVQNLYQTTGMADIMRGQAATPGRTTATEQSIKAKYGSVRMTALQNEFARFASDLAALKAEVICKHFSPETIIERSNVMQSPDADKAQAAVELLKSKWGLWRVQVKPDTVSMADMAAQRSEASEFVAGVSAFLTAAAPLAQAVPSTSTFLMELLGLVMSRFEFAAEAEGIIDRALEAAKAQQAQQAAQSPQPDPKLQAKLQEIQAKTQADMAKANQAAELEAMKMRGDVAAEDAKQQSQAIWDTRAEAARSAIKVREAHSLPQPLPRGTL